MCQILALTANAPTDICFSFEGFINRAGITDTNIDGTGIAFFEDNRSIRVLKDENPGVDSYVRNLVKIYQIKSKNIIAHIRRASQGKPKLENCHPFVRSIWGENWVFAHNGHLMTFPNADPATIPVVGETDSEFFFAYLAKRLAEKFPLKPSNVEIFNELCILCEEYTEAGIINFVLSNGECMISHCSTNLYWITRNSCKENGLVRRIDDGGVINLSCYAKENEKVTIICTMPITYEKWNKMENGQLNLFVNGELKYTYYGTPNVIDKKYEALTGLSSSVIDKVEEEQITLARQALDDELEQLQSEQTQSEQMQSEAKPSEAKQN